MIGVRKPLRTAPSGWRRQERRNYYMYLYDMDVQKSNSLITEKKAVVLAADIRPRPRTISRPSACCAKRPRLYKARPLVPVGASLVRLARGICKPAMNWLCTEDANGENAQNKACPASALRLGQGRG